MSKLPTYRARLGDGQHTCYEPTPPRRRSDGVGCAFVAGVALVVVATLALAFVIPNYFRGIAWLGHAYEDSR